MDFMKLVFEEHICHINHKETSMLSATSKAKFGALEY